MFNSSPFLNSDKLFFAFGHLFFAEFSAMFSTLPKIYPLSKSYILGIASFNFSTICFSFSLIQFTSFPWYNHLKGGDIIG
nr:MAG TPA: hypothetical protein [Bacteriophage sp.]